MKDIGICISASRAELGKGENRCRRHALKRWFGSGEVSPDGLQVRSPCVNQAQNLLCPPSAASGAAKPPRPQGASFRRKREPRGVLGRAKIDFSRVLAEYGKNKMC